MKHISLVIAVVVLGVVGGLLTGCEEVGREREHYRFTMVIYGSPGNPFWTKVVNGANEMADLLDVNLDVQYSGGDAGRQNDIIEVAISNNVDGIGLTINFDDAYDDVVQEAIDNGIPVIAFNIDDSQGAEGNARLAYVGQDMEEAGYLIAQRLIEEGNLEEGDFVVCPVESPEAVYAVQRYAGVRRALDEAGIRSTVLNTGALSLEDTLNRLTQFLLGHPETDAICAMGGMPMEIAPQASRDAGLDIPIAGFDLTRQIAEDIQEGRSLATVDQQPFYQGAFTIMQLYFNNRYGLLPCDINTGGAMVDQSNVDTVAELADTVR